LPRPSAPNLTVATSWRYPLHVGCRPPLRIWRLWHGVTLPNGIRNSESTSAVPHSAAGVGRLLVAAPATPISL